MSKINDIIDRARKDSCSDIHLTANLPPVFRKNGDIIVSDLSFTKSEIQEIRLYVSAL